MQNIQTVVDGTDCQSNNNDQYDEEVDKLVEWLQMMPHLPNITGKLFSHYVVTICVLIFNVF